MLSLEERGAVAPCPAPFNLAAHVLAASEVLHDKIALKIVGRPNPVGLSYAQLSAAVCGCGAGLLRLGLKPGDRVLLRLGNETAFPVAFLGAIAAGLVPVPTSSQLTVAELDALLPGLRPACIIASADVALPSKPECPVIRADETAAMAQLPPCDYELGDPDRLAYMVFTSGTSGRPRAAMHAHRAIWARRMMLADWSGLTRDDRMLHAGALNWTYTLGVGLLDPWSVGATAIVPSPGTSIDDLPALLAHHEVTVFAATPGVFRRLLRASMLPLPQLRHALSAGEKLPESLRADWRMATGTEVFEAFGMSEISTFISASGERPAPPDAIGYAQTGRRVAVTGPDGTILPRGEAGILAVDRHDPGLFLGYLDAKAETVALFRQDWFLTGDMVCMADDGAVHYLGRSDDMMNAGGYRVSPLEVEAAMNLCPGIRDCAATEVTVKPDLSVIACFYLADGPVAEADLHAHAETHLARYKQPRFYVRTDALPRNANGKLHRRQLRHEWELQHHPS